MTNRLIPVFSWTSLNRHVVQHQGAFIQAGDHHVHAAVAIEIAECRAAVERLSGQNLRLKCTVAPIQKHRIRLPGFSIGREFSVILHVSVGGEKILVPVVIQVENAHAPSAPGQAAGGEPAEQCHLSEHPLSQVPEDRKRFIRQSGEEEILTAVVIVVPEVRPHGRQGLAILVVSDTHGKPHLPKLAVALVVKQEVRLGVVAHENVQTTVAVVICKCDSHAFPGVSGDSRLR